MRLRFFADGVWGGGAGAGDLLSALEAAEAIWGALGGAPAWLGRLEVRGEGSLPSMFAVSDLAAGSLGAACLAVAEFAVARGGGTASAWVDRRLASLWFDRSIRPQGWDLPASRDALTGDYEAADGWVRLHVNARGHRVAALAVLGVAGEREAVARAVRGWGAEALEAAVVAAGGAAAAMRRREDWAGHAQGRAVAGETLVAVAEGSAGPVWARGFDPARPLRGVRVLDMTRVIAGPVATRFLAGFGAEVVRVDPPDWRSRGWRRR